jgi:benzoyl-CoA reductase/2-hydroxyglutaryl-CoA dehydratase subunit BcrC/BadD/HgdB
MLSIVFQGNTYKFYTFTELLGFIQKIKEELRKEVAEQAVKLVETSGLEFDLVEYYKNVFNSFIPKQEENETQKVLSTTWYYGLCGFCF